jgi:hypothetical protein
MSSYKLHRNFERDIIFLAKNMVPQEPTGLKIDDLDYEGSSDDEKDRLDDSHVERLTQALEGNDTFQGNLDLSKNNLTDQVSYNNLFSTNSLMFKLVCPLSQTSS